MSSEGPLAVVPAESTVTVLLQRSGWRLCVRKWCLQPVSQRFLSFGCTLTPAVLSPWILSLDSEFSLLSELLPLWFFDLTQVESCGLFLHG